MNIDNLQEYDEIWDWINRTLHFRLNGLDVSHDFSNGSPFQNPFYHTVYGIENMTEAQIDIMEEQNHNIFLKVSKPGQRLYALDWQHSGFLSDPRSEMHTKANG